MADEYALDPSRPRTAKSDLKFFGFLDPALGKSTTRDGDYAAIVTIGKAPDSTLYVENVWMDRVSPMKQVEMLFTLHDRYNYELFGFEDNGFQETLADFIKGQQTRRRNNNDRWKLPIKKVTNSHNKHSRISLLEPHIISGSILFQQDLRADFFIQADEYTPIRNNHDDALDALSSCVEMIKETDRGYKAIAGIKNIPKPRLAPRRF